MMLVPSSMLNGPEPVLLMSTRITESFGPVVPVLVNSDAETAFALGVAEELVGKERTISPFGPVTGSEDFAYYLQHRPGCFLRLGNGEDTATLHSAKYDFNDSNLGIGAAYWTRLVEQFLAQGATPA